jgi:4-methyl-5(b-hydroxyethyl)-thiazole monophosphate biosynthesis
MEDTIVVPLAEGFEEIEAATIIDVLRRAELPVTVAGLGSGAVTGAHGIAFETDCSIDAIEPGSVRMVVLPGGLPGAHNLRDDERVIGLVRAVHDAGRHVAAICAAPIVLARAGVLEGRPATSYPGFESELAGAEVVEDRVVRADRVITSRGPGTALEFALGLVDELAGRAKAQELAAGMLVAAPA